MSRRQISPPENILRWITASIYAMQRCNLCPCIFISISNPVALARAAVGGADCSLEWRHLSGRRENLGRGPSCVCLVPWQALRQGHGGRGGGRGDKSPNYPEVLGTLFYPGGLNGRGVPGGAVEPPSRDDRSSSSNPECLFGLATYLSLFCLHWERSRGR